MGGGSDLKAFYKDSYGAVVSTTINKYIYIAVNKKFDDQIRASYSITEIVASLKNLKHELIREALNKLDLSKSIEITSISDIPSTGTGLGSSSTYTVGLLNALRAYQGKISTPEYLAKEASNIEIELCKKPIGKQDQYAAAYGGLNYIRFNPDDSVTVEPIICTGPTINRLQENLLLLYTGITRNSASILKEQKNNTLQDRAKKIILRQMVQLAEEMRLVLEEGTLKTFGQLLDINWQLKKQLAGGISNPQIDDWYERAKKKGALGGKILGAGGGGFLMLYAPRYKHKQIEEELKELTPIKYNFESDGSKIIFIEERL